MQPRMMAHRYAVAVLGRLLVLLCLRARVLRKELLSIRPSTSQRPRSPQREPLDAVQRSPLVEPEIHLRSFAAPPSPLRKRMGRPQKPFL